MHVAAEETTFAASKQNTRVNKIRPLFHISSIHFDISITIFTVNNAQTNPRLGMADCVTL